MTPNWPPTWLGNYLESGVSAQLVAPDSANQPGGLPLDTASPGQQPVTPADVMQSPENTLAPIQATTEDLGDANVFTEAFSMPPGTLCWLPDHLQCPGCDQCLSSGREPDVHPSQRLDQVWQRIREQERQRLAKGPQPEWGEEQQDEAA